MKLKYKINKSFFLVLMALAIFLMTNSHVYAAVGGTGQAGQSGGGSGCTTDHCYEPAVGFRVTLLHSNGNRCKYDSSTKEICGDTGSKIESYDFWFSTDNTKALALPELNSSTCKQYKGHMTKQEFLSLSKNQRRNKLQGCSSDQQKEYSVSYLGWPTSRLGLSSGGHSSWVLEATNWDKLENYLIRQLKDNKTTILDNILNIMVHEGRDPEGRNRVTSDNMVDTNVVLQVDELVIYGGRAGGHLSYGFKGTVAEALWYYNQTDISTWCVDKTNSSHGIKKNIGGACDGSGKSNGLIYSGYATGWYGKNNSHIDLNALGLTDGAVSSAGSPGFYTDWRPWWKKNTRNVSHIYLGDLLDPCSTAAKAALKKYETSSKTSSDKNRYNTAIEKLITDYPDKCSGGKCNHLKLDGIKFYGITSAKASCKQPTCGEEATALMNDCYSSSNPNKKCSYNRYNGKTYDDAIKEAFANVSYVKSACKSSGVDCYKWFRGNIELLGKPTKTTACEPIRCSALANSAYDKYKSNVPKFKEYLKWLKDLEQNVAGKTRPLLEYEIWHDKLGLLKPSCDDPPSCNTNPYTNSCGTTLEMQDYQYNQLNSESQKCWQQGFAYTNGGLSFSMATIVKQGCNIYCSEKVTFKLPDDTKNKAKAGTVFKWGITESKDDSLFASMTVTRSCIVKPIAGGDCKDANIFYNNRSWQGSVKTTMKINYEEPTSTSLNRSEQLTRQWVETSSSGGMSGKCSNKNCTNFSSSPTIMTNEYNFNYNDNLKWYANKTNGNLVTNPDSADINYYYVVGYGLPTSFTTPSGVYGKLPRVSGAKGKLSVSIGSIGTDGHFNNLVKEVSGSNLVEYSCKFEIDNELFADECEYDPVTGKLIAGSPEECDPTIDEIPEGDPRDIDVVFRTIRLIDNNLPIDSQLEYAFPGRTGKIDNVPRKIGYNWWNGLADNDSDRKNVIAKVLDSSVYEKDKADYHIKLDVGKIQDIRRYNKKIRSDGKDPYTSFEKYTVENNEPDGYIGYYCTKQLNADGKEYTYCSSNFLTNLKKKNWMDGECLSVGGNSTTGRANEFVKTNGCNND